MCDVIRLSRAPVAQSLVPESVIRFGDWILSSRNPDL